MKELINRRSNKKNTKEIVAEYLKNPEVRIDHEMGGAKLRLPILHYLVVKGRFDLFREILSAISVQNKIIFVRAFEGLVSNLEKITLAKCAVSLETIDEKTKDIVRLREGQLYDEKTLMEQISHCQNEDGIARDPITREYIDTFSIKIIPPRMNLLDYIVFYDRKKFLVESAKSILLIASQLYSSDPSTMEELDNPVTKITMVFCHSLINKKHLPSNFEIISKFMDHLISLAAYKKSNSVLKMLVEMKGAPNHWDGLIAPCVGKNTEGFRMLLDRMGGKNYRLDAVSGFLHLAINCSNYECMQVLLRKQNVIAKMRTESVGSLLVRVIQCSKKEEETLKCGMVIVRAMPKKENNLFQDCIETFNKEREKMLTKLLNSSVNSKVLTVVKFLDFFRKDELLIAFKVIKEEQNKVYDDVKKYLFQFGLFIEELFKFEKSYSSLLKYACENGCTKSVKILLDLKYKLGQKYDINKLIIGDKPVLSYAAEKNLNVVDMLLESNAKVDILDKDQKTPLMYAIENGSSEEIIQQLLGANADLYQKDREGVDVSEYAKRQEAEGLDFNALVKLEPLVL